MLRHSLTAPLDPAPCEGILRGMERALRVLNELHVNGLLRTI